MLRVDQRYRMIEISVRSQNHCPQILRTAKDLVIISAKLTDVRKRDHLMSGSSNDIRRRLGEILIQQDFRLFGVFFRLKPCSA